jgi:hypothetical protein
VSDVALRSEARPHERRADATCAAIARVAHLFVPPVVVTAEDVLHAMRLHGQSVSAADRVAAALTARLAERAGGAP